MTFVIRSEAFDHGAEIPQRYTCDGDDRSPPLDWSGVPTGTRSLVLLCDDPDAPGHTWSHWAVYDIPPDSDRLEEAYPPEAQVGPTRQALTDFGRIGYGGPCPPRGHGTHRYRFRLLALDVASLGVPAGSPFAAVAKAAEPHVLGRAELTGTYARAR